MKISLEALVELINCNTPQHAQVHRCYRDYGANIVHTTVLVAHECGGYQALTPIEVDRVDMGVFTIEDAKVIVDRINQRGW